MSNQEVAASAPVVGPLFSWLNQRMAGVLLHPISFPSDQGVGVLDGQVERFLDFLKAAGVATWQVCPLGPTGYGDSPYQCFSSFAGNPYLIDLNALVAAGLLADAELNELRRLPRDRVDYGWLYVTKWPVLFRAFEAAKKKKFAELPYGDFAAFRREHASWLDGYALFLALKDHHEGKPWWLWPAEHRFLARASKAPLPASVKARAEAHAFFQYLFYGQWTRIRAAAAERGIQLIGDAPIFVARDSADVWSSPELFQIDQDSGLPLAVAGVPPDYFSADGQLWGNPLYAWEKHAATGYAWWLERLRANFALCDIVRIDHFRAFDTYWSIPADAKTAKHGEWKQGPGLAFFQAVKAALPDAKLIAEDLGDLFESVRELRDACGLPGMTILQFAFGGDASNLYLPHNLASNAIVYPGTHDNDTSLGWYRAATPKEQDHVRRYLRVDGREIGWDFIRAAYAAVSRLAVIPMQDVFSLGGEARFNTPGVAAGNWQWRYSDDQLDGLRTGTTGYLRELGKLHGRA
ncbi:MAG: 4-alpha-glucanotransferase [Burkholderiales bacterium]|nr:4-alpha-glucanotransferase [Opitutaceae bacterium]